MRDFLEGVGVKPEQAETVAEEISDVNNTQSADEMFDELAPILGINVTETDVADGSGGVNWTSVLGNILAGDPVLRYGRLYSGRGVS